MNNHRRTSAGEWPWPCNLSPSFRVVKSRRVAVLGCETAEDGPLSVCGIIGGVGRLTGVGRWRWQRSPCRRKYSKGCSRARAGCASRPKSSCSRITPKTSSSARSQRWEISWPSQRWLSAATDDITEKKQRRKSFKCALLTGQVLLPRPPVCTE